MEKCIGEHGTEGESRKTRVMMCGSEGEIIQSRIDHVKYVAKE